jgi:hypothetical protein
MHYTAPPTSEVWDRVFHSRKSDTEQSIIDFIRMVVANQAESPAGGGDLR